MQRHGRTRTCTRARGCRNASGRLPTQHGRDCCWSLLHNVRDLGPSSVVPGPAHFIADKHLADMHPDKPGPPGPHGSRQIEGNMPLDHVGPNRGAADARRRPEQTYFIKLNMQLYATVAQEREHFVLHSPQRRSRGYSPSLLTSAYNPTLVRTSRSYRGSDYLED